jgi:multidrug resistance efflux pump
MNRAIASENADYLRLNKEYKEKGLTVSAQINEAQANLQIAQEELEKSQSDAKASEAALRASQSGLRIAQQKFERYQNVSQSGALPQNQLEEAQFAVEQQRESVAERTALLESQKQTIIRQSKAVSSAKARLQGVLAMVNPSDGLVTMAKEKIAQEKAIKQVNVARLNQEKSSLSQRQSELQKSIENDNQELLQVKKDISKMVITAPISGIILKLNLRNANQIMRLGDKIAQIAPSNTPLVIKAKVSTQDIGKVKLQQNAQMRVTAYPYPDYGILKGKIIAISPDAIIPQSNNNNPVTPYYEVTIKPTQLYLKNNSKNALQSGMEMQTDIIAKDDTVLKFILRKLRILTDL